MSLISENTARIEQDIIEFLETNSIEKWNTLDIIKQILSNYLIVDMASDATIVSNLYQSALGSFEKHPDSKKANEAKRRKPAIEKVMMSSHVMNLFRRQNTNNMEASAVLVAKDNIIEKTQKEIEQQQSSKQQSSKQQSSKQQSSKQQSSTQQSSTQQSSTQQSSTQQSSTQQQQKQPSSKQQVSKRTRATLRSDSNKKKQKTEFSRLPLSELGAEEALRCILDSKDCKENVVDFTKPISGKFKPIIPKIIKHYKFDLESAITLEERRVLIDLTLCRNSDDEEKLLDSLFKTSNAPENIKYLRTAINGLFDIWRSGRLTKSNDEGWLRSNLYSFLWDRAFLFDNTFYIKRAECYSAVIKKLKENNKDLAQQRVDFILRSNHDESDYLTLEEKPTDDPAKYDYKKGKQMQRNMLTLWSKWLNSNRLTSELEAVTCQWEQRKLTVFGTRMLPSGEFITYKKCTAHLSSLSGCNAEAARLLQVVLSVKRLVTLNYMKLITMMQVIEKYSNDNLDLSVSTDQEFVTYYGSSQESEGGNKEKEEKEEPGYVHEALLKLQSVKYPDTIVSGANWEQLIIDDVNQVQENRE